MCLSTIIKGAPAPKGYGWKVVKVNNGRFSYKVRPGSELRFGRWLQANDTILQASDFSTYKSGFHIFDSRRAARDYKNNQSGVVVRVKYRKVVAVGTQSTGRTYNGVSRYSKCIIAKQMLVQKPT